MELRMGRKKKEGSRVSTSRGGTRDREAERDTPENFRPGVLPGRDTLRRGGERRSSGARVIHFDKDLRRRRRSTGGSAGSARTSPRASTGSTPQAVGHRRLRMVLV